MSIIEAVRSFLRTCPLLAGERLNVDFLPEEAKTSMWFRAGRSWRNTSTGAVSDNSCS